MLKKYIKFLALTLLIPLSSFAGIISITDPAAVTASSQLLDYDPENVIDGILPPHYTSHSAWNAGVLTGWLQVDLGATYTVDLVELYITTGNHFNILVGDGIIWSQLNLLLQQTAPFASPGTAAHHYDWYNVTPGNTVSGQFLRYQVVGGGGHWAHLGEIKVSGTLNATTAPEPPVLALMGLGILGLGLLRRKMKS